MKKFVAMLLALLLVLVNVAALAADPAPSEGLTDLLRSPAAGNTGTAAAPTFTKTYAIEGAQNTLTFTENIEFTVAGNSKNPDNKMITVGKATGDGKTVTVNANGASKDTEIAINFPAYTTAGVYKYTITEVAGSILGVDYSGATSKTINVWVYVTWNSDHTKLVPEANVFIGSDEVPEQKNESITNTYKVGSLQVTKQVTGNLADPNKKFTITISFAKASGDAAKTIATPVKIVTTGTGVTNITTIAADELDGKTIEVELAGNGTDSVTFQDIPYGVTYTITEEDVENKQTFIAADKQLENVNDPNAYTKGDDITGTIGAASVEQTVTNTKEFTPPQTGIALETLPYVLILTVAVMGAAVLVLRRREEY